MASSDDQVRNLDIGALHAQFFGLDFHLLDVDEIPVLLGESAGLNEADDRSFLLLSAVRHELRHFHDFLLSPSSTRSLFDRIYLGALCVRLLEAMLHGGDGLPVPVTSWYRMSKSQRGVFLQKANSVRGCRGKAPLAVLDLPVSEPLQPLVQTRSDVISASSPSEFAARLLPVVAELRNQVDYIWTGGLHLAGLDVLPIHLYEASALLVQQQYCRQRWGADIELDLTSTLRQAPRYDVAARLTDLPSVGPGGRRRAAELATSYCLVHDAQSSGYGSMLLRHVVVANLVRGDPSTLDGDARHLFGRWDQEVARAEPHAEGTMTALERGLATTEEDIDHCVTATAALGLSGTFVKSVRAFAAAYKKSRREIVEPFLRDPESYTDSETYLVNSGSLPQPLVRISGPAGRAMAHDASAGDDDGKHDFALGYLRQDDRTGSTHFDGASVRGVELLLKIGDELAGLSDSDLGLGTSALERMLPEWAVVLNVGPVVEDLPASFEAGNVRFGRRGPG